MQRVIGSSFRLGQAHQRAVKLSLGHLSCQSPRVAQGTPSLVLATKKRPDFDVNAFIQPRHILRTQAALVHPYTVADYFNGRRRWLKGYRGDPKRAAHATCCLLSGWDLLYAPGAALVARGQCCQTAAPFVRRGAARCAGAECQRSSCGDVDEALVVFHADLFARHRRLRLGTTSAAGGSDARCADCDTTDNSRPHDTDAATCDRSATGDGTGDRASTGQSAGRAAGDR